MLYRHTDGINRRVHKEYVDVIARCRRDGTVEPVAVCWKDGRTFYIDEVMDELEFGPVRRGIRTKTYRVRFGGHETEVNLEHYAGRPEIVDPERLRWWVYAFDRTAKRPDAR